jgi:putative oxidoreductase
MATTTTKTVSPGLVRLLATSDVAALTVLRLGLAIVMLPHGMQKVFGVFGGQGLSNTIQSFTSQGIPAILAMLVIAAEFFGSIGLIVGLLTRVAAFGITMVMVGAILLVHFPNGFFMNWAGNQPGEGFEYHLLAITIGVALMIAGGGRWSIDHLLSRGMRSSIRPIP